MGTINSTTLVQHTVATAEALFRMSKSANSDDDLQEHRVRLDYLAELAGDLADELEWAVSTLPGTAWIVAD